MFYIYKITNLINNKSYVGKSKNIEERWIRHKAAARRKDPNDYSFLHRAMNKYGFENFKVEQLAAYDSEKECLKAEVEYITLLQTNNRDVGYNLTEGGEGSSGYFHTQDAKNKMSESRKGTQSGKNNNFYGKTHSLETKKQLSELASRKIGNKNSFHGKNSYARISPKNARKSKTKNVLFIK